MRLKSPPISRPKPLLFVLFAMAFSACSVDKPLLIPKENLHTLDGKRQYLKTHMKNGDMLAFNQWTWAESSQTLHGSAKRYDFNRTLLFEGDTAIQLDSIAVLETNEKKIPASMAVLGVLTGASLAMTAYCMINPKACFGSCPTFYVGAEKEKPVAEGFSGSIAPSLEATDWDPLLTLQAGEHHFELIVRNEALETHVIRSLNVLSVAKRPGESVMADAKGSFHAVTWMGGSDHCSASEGNCREALLDLDREERTSFTDSSDLAARETLDFTWENWPGGQAGVVIAARQSLLSTFLFYQMLAYMGSEAPAWLARLERDGLPPHGTLADYLGGIEVLKADAQGEWHVIAEMREHGPLAIDRQVMPIGYLPAGKVHLRLRLAKGNWRLDQIALAKLGESLSATRIQPHRVLKQGKEDGIALAQLKHAEKFLVQMPGDERKLVFDIPDVDTDRELFLESRGYYWEWVREEWLKEENPELALRVILEPAETLRDLAPRFKSVEPQMEKVFWSSRYAH